MLGVVPSEQARAELQDAQENFMTPMRHKRTTANNTGASYTPRRIGEEEQALNGKKRGLSEDAAASDTLVSKLVHYVFGW